MPEVGYRITFSEPVTDFTASDVVVSGTAQAVSALVTGTGSVYTVAVSGMQTNGTVLISVAASSVAAADGHVNQAISSASLPITFSGFPAVTVSLSGSQSSPTSAVPLRFLAEFSIPVSGGGGFPSTTVVVSSDSGASSAAVLDVASGSCFTLEVSGMSVDGTIFISIGASATSSVASAVPCLASNVASAEYKTAGVVTVTCDVDPTQRDPTNTLPIIYKAVYSGATAGPIDGSKIVFGGTASAGASASTTGASGDTTHTITVSGLSSSGTLTVSLAAGSATVGGVAASPSTYTDNTVTYDITAPTVTVSVSASQASPTNALPIYYKAAFSETMSGTIDTAKIVASGTASAGVTFVVSGWSTSTYTIIASSLPASGTLTITLSAGAATDTAWNPSTLSTGTATVTYDSILPTVTVSASGANPTSESQIVYTAVFSESVSGFTAADVSLASSTSSATTATVSGYGATYWITVSGMLGSGTIVPTVAASAAVDAAGNFSQPSTGTVLTWNGATVVPNPFPSNTQGLWTFDLGDNGTTTITDYATSGVGDLTFGIGGYSPTWPSPSAQYAYFDSNDYAYSPTTTVPPSGTMAVVYRLRGPGDGNRQIIKTLSNTYPSIRCEIADFLSPPFELYFTGSNTSASASAETDIACSDGFHSFVVSWATTTQYGSGTAPRIVYGYKDMDGAVLTDTGTSLMAISTQFSVGSRAEGAVGDVAYFVYYNKVCSSQSDLDSICEWLHYECGTVKGLPMAYTP